MHTRQQHYTILNTKNMNKITAILLAIFFELSLYAQFSFNDGLLRSTPEAQGVSSQAVLDFFDALDERGYEVHGLMILRHDKVIAEHWWSPYAPQYKHAMYSSTKTFTAAAIGFAVQEGLVKVSDRLVDIFPDLVPDNHSPELEKLTVKHLLSMTAGHKSNRYEGAGDELVRNFMSMDYSWEPGTHFEYNVTCSHILSQVISRVSGETVYEFLKYRLFEPLGLSDDIFWEMDLSGRNLGNGGMHSRTSDMAKFGIFLKNNGKWDGKQLLDEQWVKDMKTPWIIQDAKDGKRDDGSSGYGYQTWLGGHNSFRAIGASNQVILVVPDADVVVASQGCVRDEYGFNALVYELCDKMTNKKLPAAKGINLGDALSDRALPVPFPSNAAEAMKSNCSMRYSALQNNYGISYIDVRFDKDGNCFLTLEGKTSTSNLVFGLNSWKHSVTDYKFAFSRPIYTNMMGVTAYDVAGFCTWTAENELSAQCLSMFNINTTENFVLEFAEGGLTLRIPAQAGPVQDRAALGIPGSMNGPSASSSDFVLKCVSAK